MLSIHVIGKQTPIIEKTWMQQAIHNNVPVHFISAISELTKTEYTNFNLIIPSHSYPNIKNLVQFMKNIPETPCVIGGHPLQKNGFNYLDQDAGLILNKVTFEGLISHIDSLADDSYSMQIAILLNQTFPNIPLMVREGFFKCNYNGMRPSEHMMAEVNCQHCNQIYNNVTIHCVSNMSDKDMEDYYKITEHERKNENITLAISFMIKNEELKVKETLDLYKNHKIFPEIYILDTGSTDKTLEKVVEWMKENPDTKVFIYEKEFVDFSFNRNYILDIIYEKSPCDFILCIDCNDELKGEDLLVNYLTRIQRFNTYYIKQVWKANGADPISFNNIRIVRNNGSCHWKYRVHEVLVDESNILNKHVRLLLPDDVYLYQFRETEYELEKSARYRRDLNYFLEDYAINPKDTRICYYLAQTYFFIQDYENCIIYSKKRIELANPEKKDEETYQSIFRIAKCHLLLKHDKEKIRKWCWRAWDYMKDIEPLMYIANLYEETDLKTSLYLYQLACDTEKPSFMLPLRNELYNFERFNKTAECFYKVGKYQEAYNFYSKILLQTNVSKEQKETIKNFLQFFYPSYNTSTTKPVVAIYGGMFYDRFWNGKLFAEGMPLGGSESMVIKLAELLSKQFSVYVFCNTNENIHYKGVTYVKMGHYAEFVKINKVKHLIVSRDCTKTIYGGNIENTHLWLHDVIQIGDLNDEHKNLKSIIVLTDYHRKYYENYLKLVKKDFLIPKIRIVPNIVEISDSLFKNKPHNLRFVYSSCPTRGLEKVLADWEGIVEKYPNAELCIFSDFNNDYVRGKMNVENTLQKINSLKNVKNIGRLGEKQFLEECKKCNFWYYPTNFTETFCITAVQMLNLGVIPIYNPIGALPNVIEDAGVKLDSTNTVFSVLEKLVSDKKGKGRLIDLGFEISKKYSGSNILKLWTKLLE